MATRHTVEVQGLECCVCFQLMEEPKLLACSHTFCERCLQQLLKSQKEKIELACPLCREATSLEHSDVSKLQTNIPLKSMIADVKSGVQICTVCNIEDNTKSPALCYCEKCSHYLCESCVDDHGKIKLTARHVLVSIDDVVKGKVKIKQTCAKHPQEEKEWICTSCKTSVCFRCRVIDHGGSEHEIEDVTKYMKTVNDRIASIQSQVKAFMESIPSHATHDIDLRDEELTKVEPTLDEIISQINKAWNTANQHFTMITKKRDDLVKGCNAYREEFRAEVRKIREKRDLKVACISSANDLIGKGVENVIEGQTLSVHDNLCSRLQELLASAKTEDWEKPKKVARRVACLTFTPYMIDNEHILGELSLKQQWRLKKMNELAFSDVRVQSLAATHDGKMVVVYHPLIQSMNMNVIQSWGLKVCTVNESMNTIRLQTVAVNHVSVIPDGRYVVRHYNGYISLYTQTWEKCNAVSFQKVDAYGGMDVDGCDHIYVGFVDAKVVRVFNPVGGPPVSEIPCPGYRPWTVCTMNHSEMLVLSDRSSVRVVDGEGNVMYDVSNKGFEARVAVLQDDNIVIGWWKADRVSVDLYTNQLRLVRRVLDDYPVEGYMRGIREFSTGEIALCEDYKLHIFRKTPGSLTGKTSQ